MFLRLFISFLLLFPIGLKIDHDLVPPPEPPPDEQRVFSYPLPNLLQLEAEITDELIREIDSETGHPVERYEQREGGQSGLASGFARTSRDGLRFESCLQNRLGDDRADE